MIAKLCLWAAICGCLVSCAPKKAGTPAAAPPPVAAAAPAKPAAAPAVVAAPQRADIQALAALERTGETCPVAVAPHNGIFIESVKVYDEASLEGLLNTAKANLATLNAFDQTTLVSHLGQVQGSTIAQSQNAVQLTGPSQALAGGTAPNNPTSTVS